jgi:MarR family
MKFETPCACATLRRAASAVTAAWPSGLRITQFSILRKLAHLGPLPVTRLAAEAALDRSTMGRKLNPLERAAWFGSRLGRSTSASASPISRLPARAVGSRIATIVQWPRHQQS